MLTGDTDVSSGEASVAGYRYIKLTHNCPRLMGQFTPGQRAIYKLLLRPFIRPVVKWSHRKVNHTSLITLLVRKSVKLSLELAVSRKRLSRSCSKSILLFSSHTWPTAALERRPRTRYTFVAASSRGVQRELPPAHQLKVRALLQRSAGVTHTHTLFVQAQFEVWSARWVSPIQLSTLTHPPPRVHWFFNYFFLSSNEETWRCRSEFDL